MNETRYLLFQFEKGKEYDIAWVNGIFHGTIEVVKPCGSGRNDRMKLFVFITETGPVACRPEYSESDGSIIVTLWQAYKGKDFPSLYAAAKHVEIIEHSPQEAEEVTP